MATGQPSDEKNPAPVPDKKAPLPKVVTLKKALNLVSSAYSPALLPRLFDAALRDLQCCCFSLRL
jgi:hypothetical protein